MLSSPPVFAFAKVDKAAMTPRMLPNYAINKAYVRINCLAMMKDEAKFLLLFWTIFSLPFFLIPIGFDFTQSDCHP